MLAVSVEKRLGEFTINASFSGEGGVTALFGASGAGKTSIINMIAGLLRPDRGRIVLNDEVLFDAGTGDDVPAWRRNVGYVFQDGRLFPHLSVKRNLVYGRWIGGFEVDTHQFNHVVDLLHIGHLLDRRPGALSGGEQQRVAFGRALLMRPRLLLLDEPLASLDAARKREILPYLERLRDEFRIPMIYVSHSATEVRCIANRVVLLQDGKVKSAGALGLLDEVQADMLA